MAGPEAPCDLDPADPEHVSAVHEAGHAVATDRTGCLITQTYLLSIAGERRHGQTQRQGPVGVDHGELARIDRVIALAGPAAELRFAGSTDVESCEYDNATAADITRQLEELEEDAMGHVRNAVEDAFVDEDTWFAVLATACALLDSMPGIGPNLRRCMPASSRCLGTLNLPGRPVDDITLAARTARRAGRAASSRRRAAGGAATDVVVWSASVTGCLWGLIGDMALTMLLLAWGQPAEHGPRRAGDAGDGLARGPQPAG